MPGVYRLEIHSGQIWKQLRPDHEVAQALVRSFGHRRARNRYRHIIETSHRLPHIGKHIVTGKLFPSKPFGAYRSPFLSGPTLQEASHLEITSLCERVRCIIALSSISTALRAFVHTQGYLIGDWTLHNMIWHEGTNTIYNIDLEGFYTYGPKGLQLSWEGKEANLARILCQLTQIQRRLIRSMQPMTLHHDPLLHTVTHLLLPQAFYVPFSLDRTVPYPTTIYKVIASSKKWESFTVYVNWVHGEIRSQIVPSGQDRPIKDSIAWFHVKCVQQPPSEKPTPMAYLVKRHFIEATGSHPAHSIPIWFVDSRILSI